MLGPPQSDQEVAEGTQLGSKSLRWGEFCIQPFFPPNPQGLGGAPILNPTHPLCWLHGHPSAKWPPKGWYVSSVLEVISLQPPLPGQGVPGALRSVFLRVVAFVTFCKEVVFPEVIL